MSKSSLLVCATAALSLAGLAYAQQAPVQPSPIKRTPLGKVDVPGSNYEVVFGLVEMAPGPKSARHSHPGPVMAYIAEGEFYYLIDGQKERIYKAGESFEVPAGAIHLEGANGGAPVKVMAVYVMEKGKPMVQPAQ
jgi:quercetin dioxygenase-like cupin family protein